MLVFPPTLVARVVFFSRESGGRTIERPTLFSCFLIYEGHCYDCKLFLDGHLPIYPGDTRVIQVFTFTEMFGKMTSGDEFTLELSQPFASGVVVEVIPLPQD